MSPTGQAHSRGRVGSADVRRAWHVHAWGRAHLLPRLAAGLALASALVAVPACDSRHYVTYELRLVRATRQPAGEAAAGATPELLWFASTAHKDEHIVTAWTVEPRHLLLELSNKSAEPVRIDWLKAAFTDEAGGVHGVTAAEDGAVTVLEPGARWSGRLHPGDYEYGPGQVQPLLPSVPGDRRALVHDGPPQSLLKLAGQTVGKAVAVELPVIIGGREMIYRFDFDIRDFALERE